MNYSKQVAETSRRRYLAGICQVDETVKLMAIPYCLAANRQRKAVKAGNSPSLYFFQDTGLHAIILSGKNKDLTNLLVSSDESTIL